MSECGTCGESLPENEPSCPSCSRRPDRTVSQDIRTDSRLFGLFSDAETVAHLAEVVVEGASEDDGNFLTVSDPVLVFEEDLQQDTLDIGLDAVYEVPSAAADEHAVVHALLKITPRGPALVADRSGPVAHVILALDVSASMRVPGKHRVLMKALSGMITDLRAPGAPQVLVSLVLFARGTQVLFEARPATELEAARVIEKIEGSNLLFTRYTDIVGAMRATGRIARDSHAADRALPTRISVLTDGRPQDMAGAERLMQTLRKLPTDFDALAFGDDADVAAMKRLFCGNRGGTVKHVRSETVGEAFGRIAEVAGRVVAKRSLLEIELKAGVVGGKVFRYRPGRHAYGTRAFRAGRTFSTDLGTLESGREYSLVFQLRLPAQPEVTETEIGRVTLRVPGHGGAIVFETLLSLPRHPESQKAPEPDPQVSEAMEILSALGDLDPVTQIRALEARKRLYEQERRDPHVTRVIEKAIKALEDAGTLDSLSRAERAILVAHTRTTFAARVKVAGSAIG